MKNILYSFLIVILLIIGISATAIYYLQDFRENLVLKDKISSSEIELQTNQRGSQDYLASAKATIGELSLKNKGYFNQVYTVPRFIGCIELASGVTVTDAKITNYQFSVILLNNGVLYNSGQKINIPVGDDETFSLIGQYYAYDVPLNAFSSSNIKSISIYRITEKQENPIGYGYSYGGSYSYNDCNNLKAQLEPEEEILLIS